MTMRRFALPLVLGISLSWLGVRHMAYANALRAPRVQPPTTQRVTTSVTIEPTFGLRPVSPAFTGSSTAGPRCGPGSCYSGSTVIQANAPWRVQVRLRASASPSVSIRWIALDGSSTKVTTDWLTIATGTSGTAATTVTLVFASNVSGGAALTAALEFRVGARG